MRKLFDEDAANQEGEERAHEDKLEQAAGNLQSWDLEGHKTMYEEAIKTRKRQLEKFQKVDLPFKSQDHG